MKLIECKLRIEDSQFVLGRGRRRVNSSYFIGEEVPDSKCAAALSCHAAGAPPNAVPVADR